MADFSVFAQGVVHLNAGESYLFSNPSFFGATLFEGPGPTSYVYVAFKGDLFTSGESVRAELFESPTAPSPLATFTVPSPAWPFPDYINFAWPGTFWDVPNGAVRLTALSGSVDISTVRGTLDLNFSRRAYSFPVPEPKPVLLLVIAGVMLAARFFIVRSGRQSGLRVSKA